MIAVPMELKDAQNFINAHHRHHQASHRDKFRIAASDGKNIVGVIQVGRPVSRVLDDGKTLEVLRLCSTGEKNVCSFLYSRAARIAKEMGYEKIITYILQSELGTIDGKHVIDGHGRKLIAGENVKGVLQKIDENNLYDKFKVVIANGELDILKNE